MPSLSPDSPAPHQHGPESLDAILRRTTKIPLYCHPKSWSDIHLAVLRVEGLDKIYSLEHVIGRPVACDPSDTELQTALSELATPTDPRGKFSVIARNLLHIQSSQFNTPREIEDRVALTCSSLLTYMWHFRKYPRLELSYSSGRTRTPQNKLYFCYAKQRLELKSPTILYDYPDYIGYPASFFPFVTVFRRNHDDYAPWDEPHEDLRQKRLKRWKQASKPAEMVALLIAMAQQQAKRLDSSGENGPRLTIIRPILVWVDLTSVRFVRAHIPLRYLETLSDPSKPLVDTLVVEMTAPLHPLRESDRLALLEGSACLVDGYFRDFRPMYLSRQDPILE
ncbi:hypothetical protein FQN50_000131 [Emmonsiellopsis sp. PD_5]|nr:hypothetical protein FQN50_000131 [Emmonsiellopsis sp. PD_5]